MTFKEVSLLEVDTNMGDAGSRYFGKLVTHEHLLIAVSSANTSTFIIDADKVIFVRSEFQSATRYIQQGAMHDANCKRKTVAHFVILFSFALSAFLAIVSF